MSKVKITVKENGPLRIEGEQIELLDSEGKPFNLEGKTVISLCRCGLSNKKPFCDGAHKGKFEHKAMTDNT
jgi:CDGSH-type Zn-finger protein